jgi:hypothetical protein
MPLTENQKENIQILLRKKLDKKLLKYGRETVSMPFLSRLIQDSEKIAAYSFIHSIATSLGMSIYEDVSKIITRETSDECFTRYGVGGVISDEQRIKIANIVKRLRSNPGTANIKSEIDEVLQASAENGEFLKSGNIADFYMRRNGEEYYFEIKTVKPNIDVFEKSKTKLLEWVARTRRRVNVFLAFPYNPYHPEPYSRFTEVGMMDPLNDFLVGEQYWDLLGGENTFNDLLSTFDSVGKEYKERLNKKFIEVAKTKIESY